MSHRRYYHSNHALATAGQTADPAQKLQGRSADVDLQGPRVPTSLLNRILAQLDTLTTEVSKSATKTDVQTMVAALLPRELYEAKALAEASERKALEQRMTNAEHGIDELRAGQYRMQIQDAQQERQVDASISTVAQGATQAVGTSREKALQEQLATLRVWLSVMAGAVLLIGGATIGHFFK